MNGNINVTTHMRLVSWLGSEIHIQNTDLTISQSMTQCTRPLLPHSPPHEPADRHLARSEGPQVRPETHQGGPGSSLQPWFLLHAHWVLGPTWRCHCGSDTGPMRSRQAQGSVYNIYNLFHIQQGVQQGRESVVTEQTQDSVSSFPKTSHLQGHTGNPDLQAAQFLTFASFVKSENTFSALYLACDSTKLPPRLRIHSVGAGTLRTASANMMQPREHTNPLPGPYGRRGLRVPAGRLRALPCAPYTVSF